MALSVKTQNCLNAIDGYAAGYDGIVSMMFSFEFGRAATSAAFREARKRGLIEEYAKGGMNNPIYRRTMVGKTVVPGTATVQ